jgi:ubiquinone/menaquinone biosynthesis C-methylase UbiE
MNNFIHVPTLKFNNPEKILFAAGLAPGQVFADFGAGSGFYSFAAGKVVGEHGAVFAVDVLQTALDHVAAEARLKGLRNVKTVRADLEKDKSLEGIPVGSVDVVLFSNITHQIHEKTRLFETAYRVLRTGGKLLVIDWNDIPSPIGPPAELRTSAKQVEEFAKAVNLKPAGHLPADNYHYALMFIK